MIGRRALLLVGALALYAAEARAQADFLGPRTIGMGEAIRGEATGGAAPLLNPAAMSLMKQYVIDAHYGFRVEDRGHNLFVSVVDSVTSRVAAGLFYGFVHANPQFGFNWAGGEVGSARATRQGHAAGLSLSLALGKFMLGASVKYLNFKTTSPLPKGTVPSKLTQDSVNGVTFDFALMAHLGDRFNMAIIAQNLWDHHSPETPTTLGIGLTVMPIPALSINFDVATNFTGHQIYKLDENDVGKTKTVITARLGPGIEYLIAQKVPIRLGAIYDSWMNAGYVTAGTGYMSKQFAVDLGYRGKVAKGVENYLLLGLRVFVN